MACTRGRANPGQHTKYRLFADSAGRCQNPQCLKPLFVDTESSSVHFAEAAHIVAAVDGGARTDSHVSEVERGKRENLILLCANCHTMVDKAEIDFPVDLLKKWKANHLKKIEEVFEVGTYGLRAEVWPRIRRYLLQNRAIFETYGPMSDYRFDPESEMPVAWRRHVVETILPNNRAILRLVDANRNLLTAAEEVVVARFRVHVEDLEHRHLGDASGVGGSRFPNEMNDLFSPEDVDDSV